MELWDADPEKYVEDDDEDSMNYTVRTGAMELIIDLASELKVNNTLSYHNLHISRNKILDNMFKIR